MKNPERKPYVWAMVAGCGAIALGVLLFFLIYRMQGVEEVLNKIVGILMPFIYGGVLAYLLRPMCNAYSGWFAKLSKGKRPRLMEAAAITCTMVSGGLIIYVLIIMMAPELYRSTANFWDTVPEKVEALIQ